MENNVEIKIQEEIWKDVVGFEGLYQVSNLGRVKSLDRYVQAVGKTAGKRFYQEKILNTISKSRRNRPTVNLKLNSKQCPKLVHLLIAESFLRKPNANEHVHHKDNNSLNNCLYNLEVVNARDHIISHGIRRRSQLKVNNLFFDTYQKPNQFIPEVDITKEFWKPLIGYEGIFEISNYGRFKRLNRQQLRTNGRMISIKEMIFNNKNCGLTRDGYLMSRLNAKGVMYRKSIHRLVAIHFLSNPLSLSIVHHKDSNRMNNVVDNLEWISKQDHKETHKNHRRCNYGSKHHNSILTEDKVREIKNIGNSGSNSLAEIARIFDVSVSTISCILSGRLWKHVNI